LGSLTDRHSVPGVAEYAYSLSAKGPFSAAALRETLPAIGARAGQVVVMTTTSLRRRKRWGSHRSLRSRVSGAASRCRNGSVRRSTIQCFSCSPTGLRSGRSACRITGGVTS
jgi:hypothetical protein